MLADTWRSYPGPLRLQFLGLQLQLRDDVEEVLLILVAQLRGRDVQRDREAGDQPSAAGFPASGAGKFAFTSSTPSPVKAFIATTTTSS